MATPIADRDTGEMLRDVLALSGSLGVLSVYLAARDAATPGNAAVHALELELGRMRRSLGDGRKTDDTGLADTSLALAERHVRGAILGGETRDLAIFAALGQGDVQVVHPGSAVPTRATLGPRADVRPLWRALDDARPEGVALVSGEGVTLLEWVPGALTPVWSETAPDLEEPALIGPAHAHPRGMPYAGPGFEVGRQADLFDRRMRGELGRFLAGAARAVAELAQVHGWRVLALAGEDRLAEAFARGLPAGASEVARVPRLERWRSHGELALLVAPTIAGVRARHEAGLAEQVLEGAGRRAVLGVRETLSALADARVDTLLVAAERSLAEPGGAPPVGADDTMLADAMIARAVATDASVVVLADETSSLLGDDVAALLRY